MLSLTEQKVYLKTIQGKVSFIKQGFLKLEYDYWLEIMIIAYNEQRKKDKILKNNRRKTKPGQKQRGKSRFTVNVLS